MDVDIAANGTLDCPFISLAGFMSSVLALIAAYTIMVIFKSPELEEETPNRASAIAGLGLIIT